MIASLYSLSSSDCHQLGIKDQYGLHKAVYSLFPQVTNESMRDFLFVEKKGDYDKRIVLILSKRKPLNPKCGILESKEIGVSFLMSEYYGFEVVLNPTKRDAATKKVIPLKNEKELHEWFVHKAPTLGFEVIPESLQISDIGVRMFKKGDSTVTHGTATFIGTLKVTDRAIFVKTFENGIGRAKSFGFGLLQIIPLQK